MGLKVNHVERRQFGRRETNLHAWIKIPGRPLQPCVVRNMSVGGAMLTCDAPRALPFNFELVIEADKSIYECEARHCSETGIGVMFKPKAAKSAETTTHRLPTDDASQWRGRRRRPV